MADRVFVFRDLVREPQTQLVLLYLIHGHRKLGDLEMASNWFNHDAWSIFSLAFVLQLVAFIVPALNPLIIVIPFGVLAGLLYGSTTGFIISFLAFLAAAFLAGSISSYAFVQAFLAALAGVIGGTLFGTKTSTRTDLLTLSVVAAILYEVANNVVSFWWGINNPFNPFLYLQEPAISSMVNVVSCLLIALLISDLLPKK